MTEQTPGYFRVLYFASAASYTKKDSETFEAPSPLSKLFGMLEEQYPGIRKHVLNSCAVTVNLEYVDVEDVDTGSGVDQGAGNEGPILKQGDEVGIIPPVSSG